MRTLAALFLVMACAWPSFLWAGNPALSSVPPYLVYQSEMYDDGGNPISDGEVNVVFRITDGLGSVLYEEQQIIEAIRGQLTALVGNGTDPNGAPTGGLTVEMLDPVAPRYLEVEVDGLSALEPMEIASVPYSLYTSVALDAAEGAIDSRAIADGGVEFEDLSSGLVEDLANQLTDGAGADSIVLRQELDTLYRDPSAASVIGVSPNFVYSGADILQTVLQDLDRAIQDRQTVEAQKVSKSGDTMNGMLTMQANVMMAAGATVDGYDLSQTIDDLNHIGGILDEGKVDADLARDWEVMGMINSNLWFDAGVETDMTKVNLPGGFVGSQCQVMTAFSQMIDNVEGIDNICTRHEWVDGSSAFNVRCRLSGGHEAKNCTDFWKSPPDGEPCRASYFVMCKKSS